MKERHGGQFYIGPRGIKRYAMLASPMSDHVEKDTFMHVHYLWAREEASKELDVAVDRICG